MSKNTLKPAGIAMGLILLVAGYIAGTICKIIPRQLVIYLSPLAIVAVIFLLAILGGYVILVAELISSMKIRFLYKYGIETQADIIQSELYYGPGLHAADPCFKGEYNFTDRRGRQHTFKFRKECYEPYDISLLDTSLDDYYQAGAKRQITYLEWMPFIHYLHSPEIPIPLVRGSATGLHRLD